jgi:hypothetical protein
MIEYLKKWYPNTKEGTRAVYYSSYRRHINGEEGTKKRDYKKVEKKEVEEPSVQTGKLATISGVTIYQSVLDKIFDGMKKGIPMLKVIRKEYPHITSKSVGKYACCYRSYIRKNVSTNGDEQFFRRRKQRKRRRKKPKDAIGFDKTYKVWIRQDNYDLIIRALRKYDFRATTKNIAEETRLPAHKISATLHYMIDNDMAYRTYDSNKMEYLYHPANGKQTRVTYP